MQDSIPRFPRPLALGLRAAPLLPLRLACSHLMASLSRRHPRLFARLGDHARKTVLIDPTDAPVVFRLTPDPARPRLEVERDAPAGDWDARIAGPLAALIGLVHGAYDGDALFFSRDLVIEGDTEIVLALRNAIDNEELDLAEEGARMFGPFARLVAPGFRVATAQIGRWTGVALTRAEHFEARA